MADLDGPSKRVDVIVEIVSCRDLLAGDISFSDPYVKAKIGNKDIHKTKVIFKTLKPSYTPKLNSLFFISEEQLANDDLLLKIKDFDLLKKDGDLGSVCITSELLYSNLGKNMELIIEPPPKHKKKDAGYITVCCRPAKNFMASFTKHLEQGNKCSNYPSIRKKTTEQLMEKTDTEKTDDEPTEEIDIEVIIEIISCSNLIVGDLTTSDPFVEAIFAGEEIHRTKHIWKTLNPVFNRKADSVFYFGVSKKRLNRRGGLLLKVMDYDLMGGNDLLGSIEVPTNVLEEANGERKELKLNPPKHKKVDAGSITIRCYDIDYHDKDLVQHLKEGKKSSDFLGIGSYTRLGTTLTTTRDLADLSNGAGERLNLLVEVVSCWGLLPVDWNASDPYVQVRFKGQYIHRTKHVKSTVNPVFTVKHDAYFICSVTGTDLLNYNGFLFSVMDYDWGRTDEHLGSIRLQAKTIIEATGERLVFQLDPPEGKEGRDVGKIAIRIRHATDNDRKLLGSVQKEEPIVKELEPTRIDNKRFFQSYSKVETKGKDKGVKKYLIRPTPDPDCISEKMWMPNDWIQKEAKKESKKWTEIGTGSLGKVFVEVIGADGLPNKDDSLNGRNKTDAFVSVLYEDCLAMTDVVDDCLSPRWLPWMQRAFIFRMFHSSSQLMVGVFDHDSGQHELVGRCTVDISNFSADTVYDLKYNLYEAKSASNRKAFGTISLRIRIEIEDTRKFILSNLKPPPAVYVNVRDKKNFVVMKKTCTGKHDPGVYSKKTIHAYVEELMAYENLIFHTTDAVVTVLFWRGTHPLKITKGFTIYLPINSIGSFIAGITLAERPTLIPSFFFFSIAWFLLAAMNYRRKSPNVWGRCKSFGELLGCLLFGKPLGPPQTIAKHENESASKEFEEKWKKRIAEAEERGKKKQEKMLKEREEYEKQMEEIGDATLTGKEEDGYSIDPLKLFLYPVQKYLGITLGWVRFTKNVVIWEECYFSFLIVMSCIILGTVSLIVPWLFLIRWAVRLIAWSLLGPWMKLVDIYWYKKLSKLTEGEKKEQEDAAVAMVELEMQERIVDSRLRREKVLKLKDWKAALFGKYIIRVPILKMDRYRDVPLHTSHSKPYKKVISKSTETKRERIYGQHLEGEMVPEFVSKD